MLTYNGFLKILLANYLLWGALSITGPILPPKWGNYLKIKPFVGRQPMKIEFANSIFENTVVVNMMVNSLARTSFTAEAESAEK